MHTSKQGHVCASLACLLGNGVGRYFTGQILCFAAFNNCSRALLSLKRLMYKNARYYKATLRPAEACATQRQNPDHTLTRPLALQALLLLEHAGRACDQSCHQPATHDMTPPAAAGAFGCVKYDLSHVLNHCSGLRYAEILFIIIVVFLFRCCFCQSFCGSLRFLLCHNLCRPQELVRVGLHCQSRVIRACGGLTGSSSSFQACRCLPPCRLKT